MLKLKATIRKKINRDEKIPSILYGHKIKNILLEVNYKDFEKIHQQVGESTLVNLLINKKEKTVLIKEVQRDPVNDKYIHIDFYQVRTGEKIKTAVALNFTGKSQAADESDGILVQNIDTIEIEALPKDLPKGIQVDLSQLKELNSVIRVKDLEIPANITVLTDQDQLVATVTASKIKEEEKSEEEEKTEEQEQEQENNAK